MYFVQLRCSLPLFNDKGNHHFWMILEDSSISNGCDHGQKIYRSSTWQDLLRRQDFPVEEALDSLYCVHLGG
ncbi:MAG: hypothetical protein ACI4DK_05465 [Lachnospiraceae bacterium]